MNIGNKIIELRKKTNLSQEELAEKIGVTRQTISKWELEETSPDIKQAKELSKIFNISLDELTNNDIQSVLVEKVSNTEKLAGLTIKILKFIGIVFIVLLVIDIVAFILFNFSRKSDREIVGTYNMTCTLDNETYLYGIEYNKNYQTINSGGDSFIADHIEIEKYDNAREMKAHIEDYFKDHNGFCETTIEE